MAAVVFDTSILLLAIHPDAKPPTDPAGEFPVLDMPRDTSKKQPEINCLTP